MQGDDGTAKDVFPNTRVYKGIFLLNVNHIFRGTSIYPQACSNVVCIMADAQSYYPGHKSERLLSLCNKYPDIYFIYRISITKGIDETFALKNLPFWSSKLCWEKNTCEYFLGSGSSPQPRVRFAGG